jgi:DNA-binding CsgD family transcriptional regulator
MELEARAEGLPPERHPRFLRANIMGWVGDYNTSRTDLQALVTYLEERGDESGMPVALYRLSEIECFAGNWTASERYAALACEAAEETHQSAVRPFTLYAKALIEAHLGRVDSARAAAREGMALAETVSTTPGLALNGSALAFLELSVGDAAEAHRVAGPLTDLVEAMPAHEPAVFRFIAEEIEALIRLGDLERAVTLLDRFEARGRKVGRTWALAAAGRCRALLLAARGDLSAAKEALEGAMDEHDRLSEPFELGRTLLVRGVIQRRAKEKRAARESLGRALYIFDRLGAAVWSNRARGELERTGPRPSQDPALTPTEQRIAELVATGRTNREVADALLMSTKTVEGNLSHIYRKLGVRSRTELARKMLISESRPRP